MPRKPRPLDTEIFHYFPATNRSLHMGLYLTGVGTQADRPPDATRSPKHPDIYWFTWEKGRVLPEYQLVLLTAGGGEFESRETGLVNIEPGTAIFLLPDVWHRYHARAGCVWTCAWISFNGEIPHRWQQTGLLTPETAIRRVPDATSLAARMDRLVHHALSDPAQNMLSGSLMALSLLSGVLGDTLSTTPPTPQELAAPRTDHLTDKLVGEAVNLIWNHSHQNISVGLLARKLGITRRTLERRFLAARQHTTLIEILNCRISRAERMLRETHLPIRRIAHATGFTSPTHLSRTFRQRLGKTPSDCRRNFPQPEA